MTFLVSLAVRSALMLAMGLLLTSSLGRRSAALRHRVLATSLLFAAVVAPLSLTLPEWSVTLPARRVAARPTTTPSTAPVKVDVAHPSPTPAPAAAVDITRIAFGIYLAGAALSGIALVVGLVRVRRLAITARPVKDARWLGTLDVVARGYGLTRSIRVSRTDSDDLLATWGALRPHVLLPRHADGWTADRVHVVLCHELAHIRRHDWLVQLAAEMVRVALWFNPLAWMACARLRRESEQACDDEVLGIGVGAPAYAGHLLDLVRQCRRPAPAWGAAMPMAHPSTLERRIAAMLNSGLDRRPPSRQALAMIAVLLLLVALPVAAVRARQAGPAPLSGTIYDVTGSVMPGVQVTLVDANDNRAAVRSIATGRFEFPSVAPGNYRLEAAVPGFRSLQQDFELREPGDWNRAITLQVGDLKETVTIRESRVAGAAPAAPAAAQRVRVGGNIRPPRKTLDVRPTYPASMREAGLTGVVPLEAVIGRDGNVASIRVLTAQVHPDFAVAAVDAVRQWIFTPTLLNGVPVEVVMTVSLTFDLEG